MLRLPLAKEVARMDRPCSNLAVVASLLDDVSPDAHRLLDILMGAWARADQWPHRQYVAHEMATVGLDLPEVLRELPEWDHGYQTIRVVRATAPLPNAPVELGDRISPTVHGLVHCGHAVRWSRCSSPACRSAMRGSRASCPIL